MTSRNRQRGGGKIKTVIILAAIFSAIYTAVQVVPPYINDYELRDAMITHARFATAQRVPPEEVKEKVWQKIQELRIPAGRDDISVTSSGRDLTIVVRYSVPIDLSVYQFDLKFNTRADSRGL